jgi:hypothetical protein
LAAPVLAWVINVFSLDSSSLVIMQEPCEALFDLLGFGFGSDEPE